MEDANSTQNAITDIRQTRKSGVYKITFSDESTLLCPDDLLVRWHLKKGGTLSTNDLVELTVEAEGILAKRTALSLVAKAALSRHELETKLSKAGFRPGSRDQALQRMQELGYIDDAAYARNLAAALNRQAKLGTRRIREELIRRGVDRSLANETLAEVDFELERKKALAIAQKSWRQVEPEKREAAIRRLIALLQRRGFDWSTIRWCLQAIAPEVDISPHTE